MQRLAGARELLDGVLDPEILAGNLADMARANRWLGGTALSRRALVALLVNGRRPKEISLLDIGTGAGDIPAALARWVRARGVAVSIEAVDPRQEVLDVARSRLAGGLDVQLTQASGQRLPQADGSVDIAHLSLVVHHADPLEALQLLGQAARVSRMGVIVNDLDRTWRGWAGAWVFTRMTTSNRYTRHDAPLSVRRAYRAEEVTDFARQAGLAVIGHWRDPWRYRYALAMVHPGA
jgi:ubiquinone/menaquinone biosynthesis C-methylase UbiE